MTTALGTKPNILQAVGATGPAHPDAGGAFCSSLLRASSLRCVLKPWVDGLPGLEGGREVPPAAVLTIPALGQRCPAWTSRF